MSDSQAAEAILAETQAFVDAWGRGDARAAASFFTDDAVRVGALGDVQRGRAEIEAAYVRLFTNSMPGATVRLERGTVRMLGPELAVWQGGMEITPVGGRPPLRGHVVQVMRLVDGRWLIIEAHPKFFPPPG
jgi:uncharacterized protein (TIGR02246 family)